MAKTLIAVFDSWSAAEGAMNELKSSGFHEDAIHLMPGSEFLGEMKGKREGGFFANLMSKLGLGGEEYSSERIDPNDTVLMLDSDDAGADRAADILNKHGVIDIDERRAAAPAGGEAPAPKAAKATPEKTIPVVEEELQVGKRAVKHGGVRVYSHIVEKPVEEEVSLHKERVEVERRPVGRPATAEEMAGLKESTVEVTATSEEPVVGKKARVKEEVVVSKEAGEEKETIREKLRATEIKVEHLTPEEETEYATEEENFRSGTMGSYDEMRPYYRYGYHLAHDREFRDGDWEAVEPKIRDDWNAHNFGPWDRFKDAVRLGWERGTHHQH